jgi:hypothetical protein
MKRILLLVTVALMLAGAMALSGVAQAKSPIGNKADAKCLAEASKTLQPGFNFSDYNFIGGTEGNDEDDFFTPLATDGPDVFCGFGGLDQIDTLDEGDIFLGGADVDFVGFNEGTYYGGAGGDFVLGSNERGATYYGGEGDDWALGSNFGTVYGGAGNDIVSTNTGTFYGQEGDDTVFENRFGTFDGGDGTDSVVVYNGGTLINVP